MESGFRGRSGTDEGNGASSTGCDRALVVNAILVGAGAVARSGEGDVTVLRVDGRTQKGFDPVIFVRTVAARSSQCDRTRARGLDRALQLQAVVADTRAVARAFDCNVAARSHAIARRSGNAIVVIRTIAARSLQENIVKRSYFATAQGDTFIASGAVPSRSHQSNRTSRRFDRAKADDAIVDVQRTVASHTAQPKIAARSQGCRSVNANPIGVLRTRIAASSRQFERTALEIAGRSNTDIVFCGTIARADRRQAAIRSHDYTRPHKNAKVASLAMTSTSQEGNGSRSRGLDPTVDFCDRNPVIAIPRTITRTNQIDLPGSNDPSVVGNSDTRVVIDSVAGYTCQDDRTTRTNHCIDSVKVNPSVAIAFTVARSD